MGLSSFKLKQAIPKKRADSLKALIRRRLESSAFEEALGLEYLTAKPKP